MVISEITAITVLLFVAQIFVLPAQLFNYLQLRIDRTRLRFLLMALSFFLFNAIWLMQGWIMKNNILPIILVYFGLFLASHLYSYLTKELNIPVNNRSPLTLFILLVLVELMRESSLIVVDDQYQLYTNLFFFGLFQVIALYFALKIFRKLFFQSNKNKAPIENASVSAILIALLVPLVLFQVKVESLYNLMINCIFIIVSVAYFRHHFIRLNLERKMFPRNSNIGKNLKEQFVRVPDVIFEYDLSTREREIAIYLLQGMSYEEIADKISRSAGAVRKQGSKAFAKAGVKNLKEFRKKFDFQDGEILPRWKRK